MRELGERRFTWHDYAGKKLSVHTIDGDTATRARVDDLLPALERFMDELSRVLEPDRVQSLTPVHLYVIDPAFLSGNETPSHIPSPTSSPTSSYPSPASSYPSPTSSYPSPASSYPSPTSSYPSPTSSHSQELAQMVERIDEDAALFMLHRQDADEQLVVALTQAAVRRWFGAAAVSSSFFVHGLAGTVAAAVDIGQPMQQINQEIVDALRQGQPVSIFAQPASEQEGTSQYSIATSFVDYLRTHYDARALQHFFKIYDSERQDQASLTVYHRPLGQLEEMWLASLRKSQQHKSAIRLFLANVFPLLRPYWVNNSKIIVYSLLGLAFNVVLPLSTKFLLDTIIPQKNVSLLLTFSLALFGFLLFNALIGVRRSQLTAVVVQHVIADLQKKSFAHLQRLPHQFYGRAKVGDLMTRLSSDIQLVQQALSQVMGNGFMMILQTITSLVVLFYLQPVMGALVVVIIPLITLSYIAIGKRFQRASADNQRLVGETATTIQENLSAHAVVKAFGLENSMIASFGTRLMAQLKASVHLEVIAAFFQNSLVFASLVEQLIVLGVGGYMVIRGQITIGILMAAWSVLPSLLTPVSLLGIITETIQTASGSLERIIELQEEPIAIADKAGAQTLPAVNDALVFEHVRFGYERDRVILDDLDVRIPVGTNVAIVGPSGSGKSSMISLLMRFWDPDEGRVLWDGHDVRDVTLSSLREQIGIVFQDTFVFDTTVRENIAIGRQDATDSEIMQAARGAKLAEYIESLPAGYNTMLGERGVRMSGGQRQRLAIARALLRDPRVLILDEATSALDAQTEREILETLEDVKQGRTTISVTHRLTVAATADHILVLERGKLVEQGSHEELLKLGRLYARLYHEQVGTRDEHEKPAIDPARLRMIPLFQTVESTVLARVAAQLERRRYTVGEFIVNQGEPGDAFYIIHFGQVDVVLDVYGTTRRINVLDEGEFFGEISLVGDEARTASVRAALPTECYVLTKAAFQMLLEQEPQIRELVWQAVNKRRSELAVVQSVMRQDELMRGGGLLNIPATTTTVTTAAEQVALAYEMHLQQ